MLFFSIIKSNAFFFPDSLNVFGIFNPEFLIVLKFSLSFLYSSCVISPLFSFLCKLLSASLKKLLAALRLDPNLLVKSNFVATSLAEFLNSETVCLYTLAPKGIKNPAKPPPNAASLLASVSIYLPIPLSPSNWVPVLICEAKFWPSSVPASPIPAIDCCFKPLAVDFTNCFTSPLYKEPSDFFKVPPKPNAFIVFLATLVAPNCSRLAETIPVAAACAWEAYLPSFNASIMFFSLYSRPSFFKPCSIAPI